MERNGISIDPEIVRLSERLASHAVEYSLPDYGLILAYNFPPYADASAATVAKRIRQLGRSVDVVSQDMSSLRNQDFDLTELVSEFVNRHFELSGEPGFGSWTSIRNYVLDGYAAVKAALCSKKYSFIYSRSMFPATHFLAAFIKMQHPNVFWVSEFSDPVRHDVEGNPRHSPVIPFDYVSNKLSSESAAPVRDLLFEDASVLAWCEALGVTVADRVIFTNEHQRDVMLEPYVHVFPRGDLWAKAVVSPHPTVARRFYQWESAGISFLEAGCINIGYFGEFYPNRGVGELVRAIGCLDPDVKSKFRVHVYTSNVLAAQQSLDVMTFDTSFVTVAASKKFFTFLSLASKMDALYVCDVSTGFGYRQNPYLPSKYSDYRGAGVPVIASVWPGSILSKDNSLDKFAIGDVVRMQQYLTKLAQG